MEHSVPALVVQVFAQADSDLVNLMHVSVLVYVVRSVLVVLPVDSLDLAV